jgi:hypothetical protein
MATTSPLITIDDELDRLESSKIEGDKIKNP